MVSPGNNAGAKAAAIAKIKAAMRTIQIAGLTFEPGTREFNAVQGALRTLNGVLGKPSDVDLQGAARRQIAAAPKPPLAGAPPAGMAGGAPPSAGPPPGAMGGGEEGPM